MGGPSKKDHEFPFAGDIELLGRSLTLKAYRLKNVNRSHFFLRNNQSLKEAVVVTHCQNEAEVKIQMEFDHHISPTEKAGAMRLIL